MKSNYSPYNRTFKYICLQNQLAHIKNKASAKSLGISNISISNSPQRNTQDNTIKHSSYCSTRPNFESPSYISSNRANKKEVSFSFVQPYRAIHMNQSYQKKKKRQFYLQNQRLAKKLCNIECNVTTKEEGQKNFQSHLNHKKIAKKYDQRGQLKELIRFNSFNTLTASRTEHIKNSGFDICNVSSSIKVKKPQKKNYSEKKLIKRPKSNIIKLY